MIDPLEVLGRRTRALKGADDQHGGAAVEAHHLVPVVGLARRHGTEERTGQVRLANQSAGGGLEESADPLERGVALRRVLEESLLEAVRDLLEGGDEDVLFAREPLVHGAEGHASLGSHIPKTHGIKAARFGQLDGGLDDSA